MGKHLCDVSAEGDEAGPFLKDVCAAVLLEASEDVGQRCGVGVGAVPVFEEVEADVEVDWQLWPRQRPQP